jgi:hypothetical protein
MQLRVCDKKYHVAARVTSLGEFLPIGWYFTLGSFFITEVAHIMGATR